MNWLTTQLEHIFKGGPAVLGRKAIIGLITAIHSVWAIPLIVFIRVMRPWWHIRMGTLIAERSGHFVFDAAYYFTLAKQAKAKLHATFLFWFPNATANAQWARMVRRNLTARWWVRYLIFFNRAIPGGQLHELPGTHGSRDVSGIIARSTSSLAFEQEEDEKARRWLRRRGWRDDEPFVGLLVRDSAYLSSHPLHASTARGHLGRHDHRDSDIATYTEAVRWLADRGYWIIRMGKTAHHPLEAARSRIVDYPFMNDQDDLYDIWLAANCRFFISTGTGIDSIPTAYRQPVVYVNYIPLNHICSYARNITVPKRLRWQHSGKALTLREQLQHGYLGAANYEAAGIAVENLTCGEISAAVMECEHRLTGQWQESDASRRRQARFWEILAASPEYHKLHGYIHPESRAGSDWLESMGDAFLE